MFKCSDVQLCECFRRNEGAPDSGAQDARAGNERRLCRSGIAVCFGPQVSECSVRMALAIRLPPQPSHRWIRDQGQTKTHKLRGARTMEGGVPPTQNLCVFVLFRSGLRHSPSRLDSSSLFSSGDAAISPNCGLRSIDSPRQRKYDSMSMAP